MRSDVRISSRTGMVGAVIPYNILANGSNQV